MSTSKAKRRYQPPSIMALQEDASPLIPQLAPAFELRKNTRPHLHRSRFSIDLNSPPIAPPTREKWRLLNFSWGSGTLAVTKTRAMRYSNSSSFVKSALLACVGCSILYSSIRVLVWVHRIPYGDYALYASQVTSGNYATNLPLHELLDQSSSYRSSKLMRSGQLGGETIHPFLLRPTGIQGHREEQITACMWAHEMELDRIPLWLEAWNGPVSLVLITELTPSTPAYNDLVMHIKTLGSSHLHVSELLAVHLAHISEHSLVHTHNAHLNLARLLSPTPTVILFPDGLSALPRSQFFLHDVSRGSPDRVIIIPPEHSLMDEASVTDTGSAIILPRDDSRWCPEHFSGLTISDYEECIWLFRLHYGSNGHQLSIRGAEIGWDQEPIDNSRAPDQASTFVSHSIRERLQIRYRNAVCILAGRELAVQGPWKETVYPGSRTAWIRQECGPALAADVEVV